MGTRIWFSRWILVAVAAGTLGIAETDRQVVKEVSALRKSAKRNGWTFEVSENPVLSLPSEHATGLVEPTDWQHKAHFIQPAYSVAELPAKWDWREKAGGTLTPIKNQGSCGSCWAFATASVMESQLKIRDNKTSNVSEQHLLSCNNQGWSCGGGWFAHAMHQNPGLVLGADFPYAARKLRCKSGLETHEKLESWSYLGDGNKAPTVDQIKAAILEYGPVGVTVKATRTFMAYRSGVYNACDGRGLNHAVSLVGWDDADQAWILRNSWGESWGEKGYMRIKYGCNDVGLKTTFVVYKPSSCDPAPLAYTGPDQTISSGDYTMVGGMPIVGQTYEWSPTDGVESPTSAMTAVTPSKTTTYKLKAKNDCGTAEAQVTITVK